MKPVPNLNARGICERRAVWPSSANQQIDLAINNSTWRTSQNHLKLNWRINEFIRASTSNYATSLSLSLSPTCQLDFHLLQQTVLPWDDHTQTQRLWTVAQMLYHSTEISHLLDKLISSGFRTLEYTRRFFLCLNVVLTYVNAFHANTATNVLCSFNSQPR